MTNLQKVHFSSCRLDGSWLDKMILRGKFFSNVKRWIFRHCLLDKGLLRKIFVNKSIQKPESLHIINRHDGNHIFSAVLDLTKFVEVKRFKFIGGKLSQENLERFVDAPILDNLEHLDLSQNTIYDDRMTPFMEGFHATTLTHLN